MSEQPITSPRPVNRLRLFISVLILVIAGLSVYLGFARPAQPRHLRLALLTWTEDPFWQPLIRGRKSGRINPTSS